MDPSQKNNSYKEKKSRQQESTMNRQEQRIILNDLIKESQEDKEGYCKPEAETRRKEEPIGHTRYVKYNNQDEMSLIAEQTQNTLEKKIDQKEIIIMNIYQSSNMSTKYNKPIRSLRSNLSLRTL